MQCCHQVSRPRNVAPGPGRALHVHRKPPTACPHQSLQTVATACINGWLQEGLQKAEMPEQSALRTLAQSSASVTLVRTASQLKEAVKRGDAHIEIKEHLDLSTVPPVDSYFLGTLPSTVRSIRVGCSSHTCMSCICAEPRLTGLYVSSASVALFWRNAASLGRVPSRLKHMSSGGTSLGCISDRSTASSH